MSDDLVKRYSLTYNGGLSWLLEEDPEGEYVEYSNFEAQAARIERLEASREELAEALRLQSECSLSKTSLFDDEGVEGWTWGHPDGREWWEIGDWDEPPGLHPDAQAILAKLEKEEGK